MHRIAATPGNWIPESQGVILIQQNPAPIIFLTAADTDIQTISQALIHLLPEFPELRCVNLSQLQQQLTIDNYAETVLSHAKTIILRILGGRSYWSYGLEVVKEIVETTGASLLIVPGDDRPDEELVSHSNVALSAVNQLWRYFLAGGVENYVNGLKFVANVALGKDYLVNPPQSIDDIGIYPWHGKKTNNRKTVGLIFYRSHYLAGNTLIIDALCQALEERDLEVIPIFVSSLKEVDVQRKLISLLSPDVKIILNSTSFSVARIDAEELPELWQKLNVPILQIIFSSSSQEEWENNFQGLTPKDVAMHVALPEVDGRIITRAVSFKTIQMWNEKLETNVVVYQPNLDRIEFVSDLTANYIRLKSTPVEEKKIALILANYPTRNGRIANGVGLDTPASCLVILNALKQAGYVVENIPETPGELIRVLTATITNDPESKNLCVAQQYLSITTYKKYWQTLPLQVREQIINRWGEVQIDAFPLPGIQLGNVFVGIQPSRGYDADPSLNYHAPDLEPTHNYLAYYYWLKQEFKALAIINLGKHGNLEWLPGKSLALSSSCYPEIALGSIPNFYPFIVNDPGEGSQAKRRSQATIIDHLTPPMTRAELHGNLIVLESLIDEYYTAQTLDPSRLPIIEEKILECLKKENLDLDLNISTIEQNSLEKFLAVTDSYLCELKEAQIRDGLHIFGKIPPLKQLRDLIVAIARFPSLHRLGLTTAIAKDLNLDFHPLTANLGEKFSGKIIHAQGKIFQKKLSKLGDVVELLETYASELVEQLLNSPQQITNPFGKHTQEELIWIEKILLPSLLQTEQEITNLLAAIDGKYIPPGASGAPTRGRAEVLPTGRNFYSVDIRAIPTPSAWDVGRKAAETLVEKYTQDHGEYPQTLAISIWGTSTMRTGGDDIAQVMALMGVRPVWDNLSRRVVDFEILSPSVLGRARVDVTVRVSGFFRDSFPIILELLYKITEAIASLKEEKNFNPLAAEVEREKKLWQAKGLSEEQAKEQSLYRIFTSKPGAYGAGLQGLIEAQNWQSDEDLARAYINWSSYAYGSKGKIHNAPEAFCQRLKQLQIVLHNQDNREHDLLDSDDYYQFQGGLTVAARALTGKNPEIYFGDNSLPSNPKVKHLKEEIAKVYRSRVINPKWIEGVKRHGYKGAFEIAATVDYLFAYDATTKCVEDYIYQGVAQAYLFDGETQKFIQENNPWALRDIAERLLEAHQRGLWKSPTNNTVDELRKIVNEAEGNIEEILPKSFLPK